MLYETGSSVGHPRVNHTSQRVELVQTQGVTNKHNLLAPILSQEIKCVEPVGSYTRLATTQDMKIEAEEEGKCESEGYLGKGQEKGCHLYF